MPEEARPSSARGGREAEAAAQSEVDAARSAAVAAEVARKEAARAGAAAPKEAAARGIDKEATRRRLEAQLVRPKNRRGASCIPCTCHTTLSAAAGAPGSACH